MCALLLSAASACNGTAGSQEPAGDAGAVGSTGATGAEGATGATGSSGSQGRPASIGLVSIQVSESSVLGVDSPLAGVAVAAQAIGGGALSTDGGADLVVSSLTDAAGSALLSLPIGALELTFTKAGFTSPPPIPISVSAAQTMIISVVLSESASGAPTLALVAQGTAIGYGNTVSVTAIGASPVGDSLTYAWTNSSAYGLGTVQGDDTAGTITTPTLAQANAPRGSVASGSWISGYAIPNRFGVLPILGDTDGNTTATVTVSDGFGGSASASVSVTAASQQTGAQGVAIGTRVFLNSGSGGAADAGVELAPGTSWTLLSPAGSVVSLDDPNAQFPSFIPDVGGAYRVALGTNQMTVYAGSWVGTIAVPGATQTSTQNGAVPFGVNQICASCHTSGLAIDEFTPWAGTRHAVHLTNALDAVPGFTSSEASLPSESVGFDLGNTNPAAGGLSQVAARLDPPWTYPSVPAAGTWSVTPPEVAKLANIQCESCHGPQGDGNGGISAGGAHTLTDVAQGGGSFAAEPFQSPRISYAAESCGTCHANGTVAHQYSEWATLNPDDQEGHSNLAVAQSEGLQAVDGGPAFGNATVQQLNSSCGRCHTAQGFTEYVGNLQAGNVGALAPSQQGAGLLTSNNVEPQTCQSCHDPHRDAVDAVTGEGEHQLRLWGDTPLLPSGFAAAGMGAGAVCIACHNSRDGAYNANAATNATTSAYLHEDSDWIGSNPGGSNTRLVAAAGAPGANYTGLGLSFISLGTPHEANQGDVFEGHNAYFLGPRTPVISPHAAVKDTCAGCHMANNPSTFVRNGAAIPAAHLFAITDALTPLLCSKCHANGTSNVDGASLQASVRAGLTTLAASLNAAVLARLNDTSPASYSAPAGYGAWTDSGMLTIPAKTLTDATPGCTAGSGTCGQANSAAVVVATSSNPAVSAVVVPGRSTTVLITLLQPITVAFPGGTNTSLQTFSVALASLSDGSASPKPLFAANGNFWKAIWNYELIEQDRSLGVHNPPFVSAVLSATNAPAGNPNATPVQPGGLWY